MSILQRAEDEAHRRQAHAITAIAIRVGELSGVNSSALRFSLEAYCVGTLARQATFDIEQVPLRARCEVCSWAGEPVRQFCFVCPSCEAPVRVSSGEELQLVSIDLE